jgi:sugar O-acyltransferase (sialic acid O-acetyltransferase NeuD family)
MNKKFILWGGTGQARVLREALLYKNYEVILIIDNRNIESPFSNIPIVHGETGLHKWISENNYQNLYGLAAIGGDKGEDRLKILSIFRDKFINNYTLIHNKSFVATDAKINEGVQILAQSSVCANSYIGKCVIVNTSAIVEHDCRIYDGVHIGPGAKLSGEVTVHRCAFIGTGAVILPRLSIGAYSIIGAGSVVIKDVPSKAIVVGNPAKIIKMREQ